MVEAERQLDKVNIVQPFSEIVDLEPEGHHSNYRELCSTGRGLVSLINGDARAQIDAATASWGSLETSTRKTRSFPVGIAWAARRAILENHGLYDAMIVGGADRAFLHAIYGQFDKEIQLHHLNKSHQEHYLKCSTISTSHSRKGRSCAWAPLSSLAQQIYQSQIYQPSSLFAGFGFEPDADLVVDPNGAWQWRGLDPSWRIS